MTMSIGPVWWSIIFILFVWLAAVIWSSYYNTSWDKPKAPAKLPEYRIVEFKSGRFVAERLVQNGASLEYERFSKDFKNYTETQKYIDHHILHITVKSTHVYKPYVEPAKPEPVDASDFYPY